MKKIMGFPVGSSGVTPLTSFPSIAAHVLGERGNKLGSALCTTGRRTSGYWVGYGLYLFKVELHCT